jgi:hypothetical protein
MDLRFSAGQSPNSLRRSHSSAAHIYLRLSTHPRGYERNYSYSWAHAGIIAPRIFALIKQKLFRTIARTRDPLPIRLGVVSESDWGRVPVSGAHQGERRVMAVAGALPPAD